MCDHSFVIHTDCPPAGPAVDRDSGNRHLDAVLSEQLPHEKVNLPLMPKTPPGRVVALMRAMTCEQLETIEHPRVDGAFGVVATGCPSNHATAVSAAMEGNVLTAVSAAMEGNVLLTHRASAR
ncbi:hypothetical protein ASC90_25205 [Rhizobium sp. Root1220]|nr:hypothetical protein ASC90_25205 [Rhizobium sp. Root1220]